jgi:hypothetical protein
VRYSLNSPVARALLASSIVLVAACGSSSSAPPANPPSVTPPPAAPTVTGFVPAGATAGGTNFVLTVNGTGFVATSVIQWNGAAKPTTFANATALQAPIAAGDIASAGTVLVTVVNPAPEGGVSAAAAFVVSNPVPTATAVSPSFVPPGAPTFDLTIDGAGFVAASVVRWNGADRPTTFASGTQLRATISAADVAAQGVGQVTVLNGGPGGGESTPQTVFVGNPVPTITRLDPVIVRPGGAQFTLKVLGSYYAPGAIVALNGVTAPTTVVSTTELQVAVPATHIASNGVIQVAAVNPAPGGGASGAVNLTVAPFGVSQRISVASDGAQANDQSGAPSISFDGRYVAFESAATNLVANDSNGRNDVFVRDTCTGAASCVPSTSRVSVAFGGGDANGGSRSPSVSGDGRYVAFVSEATNLFPGDANGSVSDVFVRDTCTGAVGPCTPATTLVAVDGDGSQGLLASDRPSISRDGRFVAFVTANILVLPDVNSVADAFVRDTCVGAPADCAPSTVRVSSIADTRGNTLAQLGSSNGGVVGVSIGHDGRFVAIMSTIRIPGPISQPYEVFVVDACANAPGCSYDAVRVDSGSLREGAGLSDRSLSDDARIVTYEMERSRSTVWFADSCIGASSGCTVSTAYVSTFSFPEGAALSAAGRFVVFASGQVLKQVTLYDNCFDAPAGCFLSSVTLSETSAGVAANGSSSYPTIDGPGRSVAFSSGASNLVPGDTNGRNDIFLALTGR